MRSLSPCERSHPLLGSVPEATTRGLSTHMDDSSGSLQVTDSAGCVLDFAATVRAVADGELDPSHLDVSLLVGPDEQASA